MTYGFLDTLSTPGVRAAQAANGKRRNAISLQQNRLSILHDRNRNPSNVVRLHRVSDCAVDECAKLGR